MSPPRPRRRGAGPPRLKWHKLRRRATDPPFQRANLVAALEAGAPCEVDLRFTADHHAVCLHDAHLEAETTGAGPVVATRRADLELLRQRGNGGEVLATAPLFLDEVVAAVRAHGGTGSAQVQLDVKTPLHELHPEALGRFGGLLAGVADRFIASGYEAGLPAALARAAPGLATGFDPLALYRQPDRLSRRELVALGDRTLALAPDAAIYYLEARLILAGLERGVDLVAALTGGARRASAAPVPLVDAWTVDPGPEGSAALVARLVAAGVGQITTNAPDELARLLTSITA